MLAEPTVCRYVEPLMRKLLILIAVILGLLLLLWLREDQPRPLEEFAQQESVIPAPAEPLPAVVASEAELPAIQRKPQAEETAPGSMEDDVEALTLVLRFFDEDTRKPVSGNIQLWHLNVPDSERWTAGDELLLEEEMKDGRMAIPNLAPGSYRVHALFAKQGSPDLEPFQLQFDQQQEEYLVPAPQTENVFITWFLPDGSLLRGDEEALERRWAGRGAFMATDLNPAWVNPRYEKSEDGLTIHLSSRGSGGRFGSRSHQRWREQKGADGRYSADSVKQNSREWRNFTKSRWRRDGRDELLLIVRHQGTTEYAAVFVEPRDIQERLQFPAGIPARDMTEEIQVECEPVAFGLRKGASEHGILHLEQAWPQSTITISIDVEEFAPLNLSWRPIDGPLPVIVLAPRT